jgi:hypothetical protein
MEPVGVGLPVPPPIAMVTLNGWTTVIVCAEGVRDTAGGNWATMTDEVAVAL